MTVLVLAIPHPSFNVLCLTCLYVIYPSMLESAWGDFDYRVWRDMAGAGRLIWRWEVRSRPIGALVMNGVSIESENAAKADAIKVIKQLNFDRANQ